MAFRPPNNKLPLKRNDVDLLFRFQPLQEENMGPLNLIENRIKKGRP